jgi:glycosyltransferase involved in cell wall biosynthesis
MNILHIISSGGMYGAEAVILNLSSALNEGQHRSVVGVFANSANPNLQLHEAAVKAGIESHLIPCEGQIDRAVPARIRELARQTRADVIHAHGYKADVYVYFAMRGSGTPFISTCHSWYTNDLLAHVYAIGDRLVLRRFAEVVAVSAEVKQQLLDAGIRKDRVHQVDNGIDLRPFSSTPRPRREGQGEDQALDVGWVGRLSHQKGADIFLRAIAQTLTHLPKTKFTLVGDGPDREQLESLIDELNIRQSVTLAGRREDMPAVYASFDILVSSSRLEGLPMAILEGMASSRPWIATPVGDVPSVILNDVTGVLVPPENVESLSAALVDLLRDPARQVRLGTAARKLVEDRFSAERMTEDYLRIYQHCMQQTKNRELTQN